MIVPTGVHYVSLAPGTDYGDSAHEYVTALRAIGVPIKQTLVHPDKPAATAAGDGTVEAAYDTVVLHLRPQDFNEWLEPGDGHVHIGYLVGESDRVPSTCRDVIDQLDLVLVPCRWSQRTLGASGTSTRVAVLPHIARRVHRHDDGYFGRITDNDFVFYTIGPWDNRRALSDTITAFLETFTVDDDVALIVKTSAHDFAAVADLYGARPVDGGGTGTTTQVAVAKLLADRPRPAKMFLVPGDAPAPTIEQIHSRGDCYVSLTRGEGCGLSSFEAALFGNPSIITGWGGHLDYCGPHHPFLVDYELVSTTTDTPGASSFPQDAAASWAQADRTHAGELMRRAYEDRKHTAALGAELRARLVDAYAPVVLASRMLRFIAETHARRDARESAVERTHRAMHHMES